MGNFDAQAYEQKLRIEAKIKKEVSDKNTEEWASVLGQFLIILIVFCFIRCSVS
jgi:hypothetical protein